jgi:DNA-binding transcriptional ArsR family regulator
MSARSAAPDIDAVLAALADPHRRRTVELLGEGPRKASELARLLHLPAPAMSRHLKALKDSGLVSDTHPEFDQRVRIYALNAGQLDELKTWLAGAEAGWSEQLTAFKRHVEKKPHVAKKSGKPR